MYMFNTTSADICVGALMLDVDEHQRSGQETETHYHSRLNEPPLVMESNLTTGLGPSEMISLNYEIIHARQAHAICST